MFLGFWWQILWNNKCRPSVVWRSPCCRLKRWNGRLWNQVAVTAWSADFHFHKTLQKHRFSSYWHWCWLEYYEVHQYIDWLIFGTWFFHCWFGWKLIDHDCKNSQHLDHLQSEMPACSDTQSLSLLGRVTISLVLDVLHDGRQGILDSQDAILEIRDAGLGRRIRLWLDDFEQLWILFLLPNIHFGKIPRQALGLGLGHLSARRRQGRRVAGGHHLLDVLQVDHWHLCSCELCTFHFQLDVEGKWDARLWWIPSIFAQTVWSTPARCPTCAGTIGLCGCGRMWSSDSSAGRGTDASCRGASRWQASGSAEGGLQGWTWLLLANTWKLLGNLLDLGLLLWKRVASSTCMFSASACWPSRPWENISSWLDAFGAVGKSLLQTLGHGKSSLTIWWVSAGSENLELPGGCWASSFTSKRNKPLLVNMSGNLRSRRLEYMVWFSVSIVAPNVLSKVFDSKKGVDPGTIATFNCRPCIGITNACWLCNTPWLPKRKVISRGHLNTCFRRLGSRPSKRPLTKLPPMTVLVAPKSTIPWLPCDAKQATSGSGGTTAVVSGLMSSGRAFWTKRIRQVGNIPSFLATPGGCSWLDFHWLSDFLNLSLLGYWWTIMKTSTWSCW